MLLVFMVQIHSLNSSKKYQKDLSIWEDFLLILDNIMKNISNIKWRWIYDHYMKFFWYLIIEAFDEFCHLFGTQS